ncbi:MAG: superoxide dismutase family protein [Phycisphaerae bacterium]|nr:superoxide dismutase family protein [Phycisphaerae bacterium]
MKRKMAFVLMPAVGMVLIAAGLAREGNSNEKYTAELQALNNSGVSGTVSLKLEGDELKVDIDAKGLEPNQSHPIHIHGFKEGDRASSCPSADEGDITMDAVEQAAGEPVAQIEVTERVNEQGELKVQETIQVDASELEPLDMRLVVIHGMTANGSYDESVPVACGRIEASSDRHMDMEEHGPIEEGYEELEQEYEGVVE